MNRTGELTLSMTEDQMLVIKNDDGVLRETTSKSVHQNSVYSGIKSSQNMLTLPQKH